MIVIAFHPFQIVTDNVDDVRLVFHCTPLNRTEKRVPVDIGGVERLISALM